MHILALRITIPARLRPGLAMLLAAALLIPPAAQAVPAYNRQTGQNCVACHAGGHFPDLTPYGRLFKLTGYTIGERALPLSVMGVVTYNRTASTQDPNGDRPVDFPQDGQLIFNTGSIFLAGKITDNIGGFAQFTYNNYDHQNADSRWEGHFVSDNLDVRYADRFIDAKRDLIVGASANNNPGVQDVWNSIPAWGFSVVPGSTGTGPAATPLLAGGLAQNVAGAGAYAYWNKTIYAELSGYRTANGVWSFMSHGFNTTRGDQAIVKGVNPYWRLALTKEWGPHSGMIGTFGMNADVYPDALDPSGPTERFRDIGFDAQYQYLLDPHSLTATLSYIREKHRFAHGGGLGPVDDAAATAAAEAGLDPPAPVQAATNNSDTLTLFRAKATYVYQAKYGGSLSYFGVSGSTNSLNQTTIADPQNPGEFLGQQGLGNLSGKPDTRGWTAEAFWTPLQYARVGLQYTWFSKFNGGTSNYDGFGRSAKDNNTLFFYVWGAY